YSSSTNLILEFRQTSFACTLLPAPPQIGGHVDPLSLMGPTSPKMSDKGGTKLNACFTGWTIIILIIHSSAPTPVEATRSTPKPRVTTRSKRRQDSEFDTITASTQNDLVSETKRKRASEYELLAIEMPNTSYSPPADSNTNSSKQQVDSSISTESKNDTHLQPTKRAKLLFNNIGEDKAKTENSLRKLENKSILSNSIGGKDDGHKDLTGDNMQLDDVQQGVQNHVSQGISNGIINGENINTNGVGNHQKGKHNIENENNSNSSRTYPIPSLTNNNEEKITQDNEFDNEKVTRSYSQREEEKKDTYEFRVLLSKIMDILEARDVHHFLKNDKKTVSTNAEEQVLNSNMMRTNIEGNKYNSLKGFQHDFVSVVNDAMSKNLRDYEFGKQFIRLGSRLIEQAINEVPISKRHSDVEDELNHEVTQSDNNAFPKRSQKIALVQPTNNGHVFSSGALKQTISDNQKFDLVGDVKDVAVVPQQSMSDIPSLGDILSKKGKKPEIDIPGDLVVTGVKFNSYKTYGSFYPIYNSRDAYLSYEDTIMTCAYKKTKRTVSNSVKPTMSSEDNVENDVEMSVEVDGDSSESESTLAPSEFINQLDGSDITMAEFFRDIDIEMIYESVEDEDDNNPLSDKKLDKNVKMFAELQKLQNKRFITNPDVITAEEKNLGMKLRKRLAEMISAVPPSKLVYPGSIEKAMINLPIRESAFRGMLPPNNCRAYHSNEVSREAFSSLSSVTQPSEITKVASTQLTSAVARPMMMGPPSLSQSQARPQLQQPQTHSQVQTQTPPQPFQQAQTQLNPQYYHSQVQPYTQSHSQVQMQSHPQMQAQLRPQQPSRPQTTGYAPMNSPFGTEYGIPGSSRHSGYYGGQPYPPQYPPHLQSGYHRPQAGHGWQMRPGY
ncbi:13210_t:CDS:2, partial [Acaulospora morrowiae]